MASGQLQIAEAERKNTFSVIWKQLMSCVNTTRLETAHLALDRLSGERFQQIGHLHSTLLMMIDCLRHASVGWSKAELATGSIFMELAMKTPNRRVYFPAA
jgi:hypothetical protein